jgi:hypothetical protein
MSNTRQEPNVRPAVNSWPVTVEAEIRRHWGEHGWRFPEFARQAGRDVVVRTVDEVRVAGIADLIERSYPDFATHTAAVAELVASVSPHLAKRGALADGEYDGMIREPLYRALPFLDAVVRETLARELVALHAVQTP